MEISCLFRLFLLYNLLVFQYFHENLWKFGMELEMKLRKKIIMESDGKFMKFHEENFFYKTFFILFFLHEIPRGYT